MATAVVGVWLLAAPAAHAVGTLESAVWWRNETGAAALPAPPQVPAGGLWVSNDPSGASAISALRFTLPDSEGLPTLSLHVSKFTSPPANPATPTLALIRACLVTADWSIPATSPGAWTDRPNYDCAKGSAPGQLSPDGSMMVFDLTVLPPGLRYDIALVPAVPSATTADPTQAAPSSTFDATFEPVKRADLAVVTSPPPSSPSTAEPASPPPAQTAVGPESLGSLDVPIPPGALAQQPAADAAVAPVIAPGGLRPRRALAQPAASVAETSATVRAITGLVFCALAAWAWRALAAGNGTAIGLAGARPAMNLGDSVPPGSASGLRRRFTAGARVGAPPALR
jgi:hypothetical protein